MSYKPDYGLRLNRDGYTSEVDIHLPDFRLYSLTVLGRGRYSTMAEIPYAGEAHAVSLDFSERHLQSILDKATSEMRAMLLSELARDASSARTIELEVPVPFGVRARLGEIEHAPSEDFVPLIVQEIL